MEFKNIKFRKGIRGTDEILYEDKKQIAFYGRSNVGKSSSINTILGRKNLVKSSATPGKTKEINFFEVDEKYFFVDLPGYGYAKISKVEREKLRKLILWYILYSEVKNRLNVIVIDARRGLSDFDKQLVEIFQEKNEEFLILINKIDKLNQRERSKLEKEFSKKDFNFVLFSAKNGRGRKDILENILSF